MNMQRGLPLAVLAIAGISRAIGQEHQGSAERTAVPVPSMIAWEVLDKTLSDGDERHRQQAVLAGESIGPTVEAVKFVGGALQDKSVLVRQSAVTVLGELKLPESVPYLNRALDDNPDVSFAAARALCERGEANGCAFLQDVLRGDRKEPNKPGFLAKNGKYLKKKFTPEEIALMGVREASAVLLGPASLGIVVGEEAYKAQTGNKNTGEPGRAIAAEAIADHPDEYTRALLEWALQDSNWFVRAAAARGLGKCGSAATIPKLQLALTDSNVAVRCMAAGALIRLCGHNEPER